MRNPIQLLAFGFGAGLSPKAPGTVGTLVAFPVYGWLMLLPTEAIWAALAVLFALGVWVCDVTGKQLGEPDHSGMVWDEIVAFVLVLNVIPQGIPNRFAWFVAAFALFRLFDIWKPFPIRYFDRTLKGGFGVMFDDLLAAGYTILVLFAAQSWLAQ